MKKRLLITLAFSMIAIPYSFGMEMDTENDFGPNVAEVEYKILLRSRGLHPIFSGWNLSQNNPGPYEIAEIFSKGNDVTNMVEHVDKLILNLRSQGLDEKTKCYLTRLMGISNTLRHVETWIKGLEHNEFSESGALFYPFTLKGFLELAHSEDSIKQALEWHKDVYCAVPKGEKNDPNKLEKYWNQKHTDIEQDDGDEAENKTFFKFLVAGERFETTEFFNNQRNRGFLSEYRKLCKEVYKKFDSQQYTVMVRTIRQDDVAYEWGKSTKNTGLSFNFTPLAGCLADPTACTPMIYARNHQKNNNQLIAFWIVPNTEFEKASQWKNVAPFYKTSALDDSNATTEKSSLPYGIYAPFKSLGITLQTAIALTYYGEMAHPRIFGKHPFKPFTEFSKEEIEKSLYDDWNFWKKVQTKYAKKINLTFVILPQLSKSFEL